MGILLYVLGAFVGLLGLVFVAGNQGEVLRIVVGAVLMVAAIAMVVAARMRPKVEQRNVVQRIELGGDARLEKLTCAKCGAAMEKDDLTVQDGAVIASCRFCKASYQMEEAPKW